MGDALGFVGGHAQPSKLAAMAVMWKTEPTPAPFNLAAWPLQSERRNAWSLQIPYVLTPFVTHTMDTVLPGVDAVEADAVKRIRSGIPAVVALKKLSATSTGPGPLAQFEQHKADLGFGFLVQRYPDQQDVSKVTEADIAQASRDTVLNVFLLFWSIRLLEACGLLMLAYFVISVIFSLRGDICRQRWFLLLAPWTIPVPFIACEMGWVIAEVGRQPWTVFGAGNRGSEAEPVIKRFRLLFLGRVILRNHIANVTAPA
ncbi:cytochrome ubiquinol oxidase subunit I [Caballeronia sp. LjRoot31]